MDRHLMTPDDLNEVIFDGLRESLGQETVKRIEAQYDNYDYYSGKQHENANGELVHAKDLERPPELDYDPTRFATNYFKATIDRKARWQMGGEHSVRVPREQIDDLVEVASPDYEPSEEQLREDQRASEMEELLRQLWDENRMRAKLIQAARDRLIADRVVCKIVFNPNTGKLMWIWRPDPTYIPVYSDDDFEELIEAHFLIPATEVVDGEEEPAIRIQSFYLEGEEGQEKTCYLEEHVYLEEDMELIRTIQPKETMELDFIPVVEFGIDELVASDLGDGEISHLREQNDVLNSMNEDAIDALKFEMFPVTALINVPEGTADRMFLAPGAVVEIQGSKDGIQPTMEKVESRFTWKEAFNDEYNRVKGAMHEVSGLPQLVPQEMNIGGLNTEALRILFHDIISDTEEHWHSWEYSFRELHEKSIKYLQARTGESNFAYDKDVVRRIEDYYTEMQFVLPLPDNRKEQVDLLSAELLNELESKKGAMERLGVPNVQAKMTEIENEQLREKMLEDPYGELDGGDTGADIEIGSEEVDGRTRINENGEVEEICPNCGGSGRTISEATGDEITCPMCRGTGWHQPRKR